MRASRLLLFAILIAAAQSTGSGVARAQSNDNYRWQQLQQQRALDEQRRQQDLMRHEQQRRQQETMRQEQQRRQQETMRQEQQRRQQETMRLEQERQREQARRQNEEMRRRQANDNQTRIQQRRSDAALVSTQRTRASNQAAAAMAQTASARQERSRKLADLGTPPSLAEIKQGFRGQFASDGRAIVRVRGRMMLVNARLVGRTPPVALGVAGIGTNDMGSGHRRGPSTDTSDAGGAGGKFGGMPPGAPPGDGGRPPRRLKDIYDEAARNTRAGDLVVYSGAPKRFVLPQEVLRERIRPRMESAKRADETLVFLKGDKKTALAFKQSGDELIIMHVRTSELAEELGSPMGGAFTVEALNHAGVKTLPKTLRLHNVREPNTVDQLAAGRDPSETTLGKLARRTARGFGQRVVSVTRVEDRGGNFDLVVVIAD